jgi:hypothetical protein
MRLNLVRGARLRSMRRLILLFLMSACASAFCADVAKKQPPPKKQLSQVEKQWCPTIESALAGTADMEPAMRSYVLHLIAGGLKKCDPRAVRKVLVDAFSTTLAIPDTEESIAHWGADTTADQTTLASLANLEAKQFLQTDALTDLLAEDEAKVQSLLPQAEPFVRGEVVDEIIARAIAAKKLDRALNVLKQAPPDEFPYGEATNLMLELPAVRDAQKQEIFQWAMAADHDHHSLIIGGDDFGSMIVRFWEHLPPTSVLQAIHQVLDGARSDHEQISQGAGSAKANFSNEYDYRVFELLPVLKELDKDEADQILSDSQAAKSQLQQFPNGIQSLNPAIKDTPPGKGEKSWAGGMVGNKIGPMLQQSDVAEAYETRIEEIVRMAQSNPKQAIAEASGLPNSAGSIAPHAEALLKIAGIAWMKNPLYARDALEEVSEVLKNVEPTGHTGSMDYWLAGIEIAKRIGEIDLAKKLLKGGMGQVENLKSKDTDSDAPNLALKASWPSTAALSRLILAAADISPQTALGAIAEISDPEVRLLCQVRLANQQLGAPMGRSVVMMQSTKSAWAEYGSAKE